MRHDRRSPVALLLALGAAATALAMTSAQHAAVGPDAPTMAESGLAELGLDVAAMPPFVPGALVRSGVQRLGWIIE